MIYKIEVLEELTDKEIEHIVRNSQYLPYLEIFKKNTKKYAQYVSMLGSMQKKSSLVQLNLPKIIVKLFRRKDQFFVKVVQEMAEFQAAEFVNCISEILGEKVSSKQIQKFSEKKFADIIRAFKEEQDPNAKLDFELLWAQLRLYEVDFDEDKKHRILELCNQIDGGPSNDEIVEKLNEESKADIIINDSIVQKKEKKIKPKKLTAQEKAEKYKIARLKKEKDNNKEFENTSDTNENNDIKQTETDIKIDVIRTKESNNSNNKEESQMVYIGIINIIGDFYNFTPIGTYDNHDYYPITEGEINKLLPKSAKNNINFYYNIWDRNNVDFMRNRFHDDEIVALNCSIDQLELNKKSDGQLNETGYRISAIDGCKSKKIAFLSDIGLFRLIQKDNLDGDILTQRTIQLKGGIYTAGEYVLVNIGEGFYAGPYEIKYSEMNSFYYIVSRPKNDHYYLTGYNNVNCKRLVVETSYDAWITECSEVYYSISDKDALAYKDIIAEEELLASFAESLNIDNLSEVKTEEIPKFVGTFKESGIFGKDIPESVSNERIKKLQRIFESENRLDDLVSNASEIVYKLLLKKKDDKQTNELLTRLIEDHPEFMEKFQGFRIVQSKLESAKKELEEIEAKAKASEEDSIHNKNEGIILSKLNDTIKEKEIQLEQITKKLEDIETVDKLASKVEYLRDQEKYYEKHLDYLRLETKGLEQDFVSLINRYSEKMTAITFDGFMSSKMLQAAAEWEKKRESSELGNLVSRINAIEEGLMSKDELVNYIVSTVKKARPKYDYNSIINIAICCTQGFLTVFSGAPGAGKTSICNIYSKVLGLTDYSDIDPELKGVSRYIPVSVERGWTSKRDFVGYYNPLTKSFEENNKDIFNGLKLLNEEKNTDSSKYPYIILLDEANLSPMEYYWADFMNVCDDRGENSFINLGNDNIFNIPETLHFVATVNNDHTTETLSPRLIDRAWVITLPKNNAYIKGNDILKEDIRHITWKNLKNVFVDNNSKTEFDRETTGILEGLKERLIKQSIYLSPRVNMAMLDYWRVASEIMQEDEYGNQPSIISLDFAISQKVLPKINGSGDEFGNWLSDLKDYCNSKNLMRSADILEGIIKRGSMRMKYFDFFN